MAGSFRRWLKYLFVAFLLLCGLGGYYCWQKLNKLSDELKPTIEKALSSELRADVVIGDVTPTLLPQPSLKLVKIDVSLGANCPKLIDIEEAYLRVKLEPLFERRVIIDLVTFENPVATIGLGGPGGNIILSPSGQPCTPNPPTQAEVAAAPPAPPAASSSQSPTFTWGIAIDDFAVHNAYIKIEQSANQSVGRLQQLSVEKAVAQIKSDGSSTTINGLSIEGALNSNPLSITLPHAAMLGDDSLQIDSLQLTLGKLGLTGSASFGPGVAFKTASIKVAQLALDDIPKFIAAKPLSPKVSGTIQSDLQVTRSDTDGSLRITGNASSSKLQVDAIRLTADALSVDNLDTTLSSAGLPTKLQGKFSTNNFKIISGTDTYTTSSASVSTNGSFTTSSQFSFNGNANVVDFGFLQGEERVERVRAALNNISVNSNSKGDLQIAVTVNGSAVQFRDATVDVKSVQSISGPLAISIPAKGGYAVSGPVTIRDANINLAGRALERTSGTATIFISGPKKSFKVSSLNTKIVRTEVSANAEFEMLDALFNLKSLNLGIAKGTLTGAGYLTRDKARTFKTNLKIKSVPAQDLLLLVDPSLSEAFKAQIEAAEIGLQGGYNNPLKTLKGNIEITASQSIVKGFNLVDEVIEAIARIPGFGALIPDIRAKDKKTSGSISASINVSDETAYFTKVTAVRSNFTFKGSGQVGFNGVVNGNGSAIFLQETFSSLGGGFSQLSRALGRAGRFPIPLIFSGKIPDVNTSPDLPKLAKQMSGLGLAQSAVNGILGVGSDVLGFITSPFRSSKPTPAKDSNSGQESLLDDL